MISQVIEPLPEPCPACGNQPGDGRILIGWLPCSCPGARHGGHRTHECARCATTTYGTRHTNDRLSSGHWRTRL